MHHTYSVGVVADHAEHAWGAPGATWAVPTTHFAWYHDATSHRGAGSKWASTLAEWIMVMHFGNGMWAVLGGAPQVCGVLGQAAR